ncbi:MBL fold metallo-hydrolase [Streptomyces hirsutus]|uniref:MBL fold metallo-hydrolase n=1 Tax=Streptomyces hirsutus TaxID=35620 RepID=UPI000AD61800
MPDDEAWVVALRLYDPATGASVLYAPALAAWLDHLHRAAAEADCVIVDGTFWDDEEPRRAGVCDRTATGMGHLPVDGSGGTAADPIGCFTWKVPPTGAGTRTSAILVLAGQRNFSLT